MALVCLALAVPGLPGWFHFSPRRQLVVGGICLLGLAATLGSYHRPAWMVDRCRDRVDLFDWVMVLSACFFAMEAWHSGLRWWRAGELSIRRITIVSAFTAVALFGARCFVERRGWQRTAGMCFFLGAFFLMVGIWQLLTGTESARHADIPVSRSEALKSVLSGISFIAVGLIAHAMQKRKEPQETQN